MRLGNLVPLVGTMWEWDIEEIMTRTSCDMDDDTYWSDDHWCEDDVCEHESPGIAERWDFLLEQKRDDGSYESIVESLLEHGFTVPLTAYEENGVVCFGDGHHRLAAAIELGMVCVPVLMCQPGSLESGDWDWDCPPPNGIVTKYRSLDLTGYEPVQVPDSISH